MAGNMSAILEFIGGQFPQLCLVPVLPGFDVCLYVIITRQPFGAVIELINLAFDKSKASEANNLIFQVGGQIVSPDLVLDDE
jgi:hypothetical protein